MPKTNEDVNNHIHTTYSFSPYSPPRQYGFLAGGPVHLRPHRPRLHRRRRRVLEACHIVGILGTVGIECRVTMKDTPLPTKSSTIRTRGMTYLTIHGCPMTKPTN